MEQVSDVRNRCLTEPLFKYFMMADAPGSILFYLMMEDDPGSVLIYLLMTDDPRKE